ncbi:GNAT family N-acetyltransferase [Caballeronia sp. SBC2]|uniref:GNAT family N-acetyltransferase n=1 Tax=Caballeronia sp. SBC2 TaxID=2705547 RepID=UPI0013E1F9EA|nr:GNAT family N-acetyltransferase [Caballeronia sp. SBC2]QIE24803.1 Acetyltransferase (GNAT) domain protein [Caballeronia sp. SBC2]
MRNAESQVEIICDSERFRALRDEWDDLWVRASGQYHESFLTCWQSWLDIAKPRGSKLRCIVARKDGRLVMVWPLARSTHAMWKILRPLGPEAADYTTILLEPGANARALTRQAWNAALTLCGADVIQLPYFSSRTELHMLVSGERHHVFGDARQASVARLTAEADWSSFCRSLGTLSGKKPGALERRLAKQGTVNARLLTPDDVEENAKLVEWTLLRKREWASRVDKRGAWLYSSRYRDFLVSLLNAQERKPIARLCLITVNGEPVATTIVGIGQSSIKGIITGFDERYAKFSPGQLVVEYMVKWAFDNHFDFDFGVGTESFKTYWSRDNTVTVASAQIAASAWGCVAFRAKELVGNDSGGLARLWHMALGEKLEEMRTAMRAKSNGKALGAADGDGAGPMRQNVHERRS